MELLVNVSTIHRQFNPVQSPCFPVGSFQKNKNKSGSFDNRYQLQKWINSAQTLEFFSNSARSSGTIATF